MLHRVIATSTASASAAAVMKSLCSLLLFLFFAASVSVVSAQKGPQGTDSAVKPVRGIDVVALKNPGNSASRQTAQPNKDGSFSVNLPEPGHYKISYASGPQKGQLITEVTVTKAGAARVALLSRK